MPRASGSTHAYVVCVLPCLRGAARRGILGAFCLGFLIACTAMNGGDPTALADTVIPTLDDSAVERYWAIQDALSRGESVPDGAWQALWETAAFQWQASNDDVRSRIRGRMELAFQPDPEPLAAELAAATGYDVVRWRHLQRQRELRQELGQLHRELMGSTVVSDALALARCYLPEDPRCSGSLTTPIRLLFFAPDSFADQGELYVDLLNALDRGDDFVRLLAHELHHDLYLRLSHLSDLDEDSVAGQVALALRRLHMEGLADRIDKLPMPLSASSGLSPSYVADYNRWVLEAPQTMARFEWALAAIPGADDPLVAARAAWRELHLGGHPEGFVMAQTIAEAQGGDALLPEVGDPFAFLRRFHGVQPFLSPATLEWLATLESNLLRDANSTGGL